MAGLAGAAAPAVVAEAAPGRLSRSSSSRTRSLSSLIVIRISLSSSADTGSPGLRSGFGAALSSVVGGVALGSVLTAT
jgi:hypothetical protein